MIYFPFYFILFLATCNFVMIWLAICNDKTFEERQKIRQQQMELVDETITDFDSTIKFHTVSYNRHLWYRFTFRNPLKLYSYEILKMKTVGTPL